ncbi:hypothetical protein AB0I28_31695 [Phytomonospora sp. NPDC050363]|uniref:hypothetical protein n=1 Tax=Phytomonospora sp. NPDC050363 TaxID=3155642 RepID=UPI0033E0DADB
MRRVFAGALVAAVVLSGCARQPIGDSAAAEPTPLPLAIEAESAAAFTAKVGRGIAFDYEPTASPSAARESGDLIVEGAVTDVRAPSDAERSTARESGYDDTVVMTVNVADTLDGEASAAVTIVLPTGPGVDVAELLPLATGLRVIAALNARGDRWSAQIDGLWFQGSRDTVMHGPYAEPWELPEPWGGADTLDEYAAAIRRA